MARNSIATVARAGLFIVTESVIAFVLCKHCLFIVSNAYLIRIDCLVNTAYKKNMKSPVKLKRGDLRDALIDYAMQAAIDGHIETMSLRKAARDLGVSSGAVYRHFADKDSLLVEIAHIGFEELKHAFRLIRPENEVAKSLAQVVERTYAIARVYINFALQKPALWHMMFGRVGVLARDVHSVDPADTHYTPLDVASENLIDLYRLGALSKQPTLADVRYMWSTIHGTADLAQSGLRLDADELDQIIEDTVVRSLRAVGYEVA